MAVYQSCQYLNGSYPAVPSRQTQFLFTQEFLAANDARGPRSGAGQISAIVPARNPF